MVMQAKLSPQNQRELSKLIISIRANAHHLDLFLAVCDDRDLRDLLIQQYETTLANEGFTPYRVGLNPKTPSLKATLDEFVKYNPGLPSNMVVTVLGSSSLFGVRLTEDQSEQEKFFFSLQWTREALREFKFPVVIWLSNTVATDLSQQAPDFWSWRSGVFEFEAQRNGAEQSSSLMRSESHISDELELSDLETSVNTIADLQQQIAELSHQNPRSPLLMTLYSQLGDAYRRQFVYDSALHAYKQALEQAGNSKNQSKQADIFFKLGGILLVYRRYSQAQTYYQQALDIAIETNNLNGQASTYHQLGRITEELGDYEQARTYYQKALDIFIETNNRDSQAITYHQLGMVAEKSKDYEQAQVYCQQALEIKLKTDNRDGQAATYHQLGRITEELGDYEQARTYYQQALDIFIETNNLNGQAITYFQLGIDFEKLGAYGQARTYYQQALNIFIETNDRNGQAKAYFHLGKVAEALMDIEAANAFYLQDLQITAEANDQVGLDIIYRNLVRFYQENPNDDFLASAAQLLNMSLGEFKSMIAQRVIALYGHT